MPTIVTAMKDRSGQNHDNKIAPQANFNPTAANIMDMLCIFVITKQYIFSVLVIIFCNKSYFVLIIRILFPFMPGIIYIRECQGETLSGKETKEVFSFKIGQELVVCR